MQKLAYSSKLKNRVCEIIRGHGTVTNRAICEHYLGIPYGNDSNGPVIRQCVHTLRNEGIFIAADSKHGYWIETDLEKQNQYLARLLCRIESIQGVYDSLYKVEVEK